MGVSELWPLVKPSGRTESLYQISLEGFKTKASGNSVERVTVIGVDMGTYFGECVTAAQNSGMHTGSSSGPFRPLFFRLCKLLKDPASFVFVFDGPERPSVKRNTQVQANKPVWWADTAKTVIRAFGFYVHQAPGEAEAELAMLNRWGLVDAVLTTDGDALVFGAIRVLKMLPSDDRHGTDNVELYDGSDILSGQGFTAGRLVLYALAAGGDYDSGLNQCGRVYASELALSGVGDTLYTQMKTAHSDAERKMYLKNWKQRTLQAVRNGTLHFSTRLRNELLAKLGGDFPPLDTVKSYVNPATSATFPEYLSDGTDWRAVGQPNARDITDFCRSRLDWSNSEVLFGVLQRNLWEGLVLRLMYSEQCNWNADSATFGTAAHELTVQACRLKPRGTQTAVGQMQGRVQVREPEVIEILVGEDIFPDLPAEPDRATVEAWAPSALIPGWASKFGKWINKPKKSTLKGKGKGKEKKGQGNAKGKGKDDKSANRKRKAPAVVQHPTKCCVEPGSTMAVSSESGIAGSSKVRDVSSSRLLIEPTGNVFQDLKRLEEAQAAAAQVIEISSDDELPGEATTVIVGGEAQGAAVDRGEGPSKRRKVSKKVFIDLTLSD